VKGLWSLKGRAGLLGLCGMLLFLGAFASLKDPVKSLLSPVALSAGADEPMLMDPVTLAGHVIGKADSLSPVLPEMSSKEVAIMYPYGDYKTQYGEMGALGKTHEAVQHILTPLETLATYRYAIDDPVWHQYIDSLNHQAKHISTEMHLIESLCYSPLLSCMDMGSAEYKKIALRMLMLRKSIMAQLPEDVLKGYHYLNTRAALLPEADADEVAMMEVHMVNLYKALDGLSDVHTLHNPRKDLALKSNSFCQASQQYAMCVTP